MTALNSFLDEKVFEEFHAANDIADKYSEENDNANIDNKFSISNLVICRMNEDSNCLFCALSVQLQNDNGNKHCIVRTEMHSCIDRNKEMLTEVILGLDCTNEDEQIRCIQRNGE